MTFPANEQARVSAVKRFFGPGHKPSAREFESFLRASGLSHSQARGVAACGYQALSMAQEEDDESEVFSSLVASIRRATEEIKRNTTRQRQASDEEKKASAVYSSLIASIKQATEDMKAGFNPAQPRDPRGNPEGGEWSKPGGGSGSRPSPQPLSLRRPSNLGRPSMPDEPGLGHPLSPLDLIGGGGVIRVLKPVAGLSIAEAATVTEAIAARFSGSALAVLKYSAKVRQAAGAVEEFLGGRPDLFRRNKNGDAVIMKGDKKVRFDIRDPGKKRDGSPDQPHFHLQKQDADGKWKNMIEHRHYFRKD
jgi:hypothetical protein